MGISFSDYTEEEKAVVNKVMAVNVDRWRLALVTLMDLDGPRTWGMLRTLGFTEEEIRTLRSIQVKWRAHASQEK